MATFELTVRGDKELAAKFKALAPEVERRLRTKIDALTLQLARKVKVEHLSGPTGAHSLSVGKNSATHTAGQLRASVFSEVTSGSSGITGRVGYAADVAYAGIHEFGGTINHPGGTAYFKDAKSGMVRFVSNKTAIAAQLPRTKPHLIHMPERAPLRTAFKEMTDQIRQGLQQAVSESLSKA